MVVWVFLEARKAKVKVLTCSGVPTGIMACRETNRKTTTPQGEGGVVVRTKTQYRLGQSDSIKISRESDPVD